MSLFTVHSLRTSRSLLEEFIAHLITKDKIEPYITEILNDKYAMDLIDQHEAYSASLTSRNVALRAMRTRLDSLCTHAGEDKDENAFDIEIPYEEGQEFRYTKVTNKINKTCYISSVDCVVGETVPKSDKWSVRPLREGASVVLKQFGKEKRYFFIRADFMERERELSSLAYRDEIATWQIRDEFESYCLTTFAYREPLGLAQSTGSVRTSREVFERSLEKRLTWANRNKQVVL